MSELFHLFQLIFQLRQDRRSSIKPSKQTILFLFGTFGAGLVLMIWFYLAEAENLAHIVLNFVIFMTVVVLIGIPIIKNLSNGIFAQIVSGNHPISIGRRGLQRRHPLDKHRQFQRIRQPKSRANPLYLQKYRKRKAH